MRKKYERGITLIALVITVIILLILAGVTISMLTGENGILLQAQNAKEKHIVGEEKEQVNLAATEALMAEDGREITTKNLDNELEKIIGVGKYILEGNGPWIVTFVETGHSYEVDKDGIIKEGGGTTGDEENAV